MTNKRSPQDELHNLLAKTNKRSPQDELRNLLTKKRSFVAAEDKPIVLYLTCPDEPLPIRDDRALIDALERSGLAVHIRADWRGGVDAPSCRGLLPRGVWDYDEHPRALEALLDAPGAWEPRDDARGILRCRDKRWLAGLKGAVPTRVALPGDDVGAALRDAKRRWTRVVAKPLVGTRGRGCVRLDDGEALPEAGCLLQPYLEDVTVSGEKCLVFVDGDFSHAVRKKPQGWGAADDAWASMPVEAFDADDALRAAAEGALAAVLPGLRPLVARVDFLPAGDGAWLVSEVDCGWCELFLRAAPPGAADRVAAALRERIRSRAS